MVLLSAADEVLDAYGGTDVLHLSPARVEIAVALSGSGIVASTHPARQDAPATADMNSHR